MAKTIGLINLHSNISFKALTERRPVASVSFLGRYGMIDFVLSNFSNSDIDSVGVLIQEKPRSLFGHLGFGNEWNFNRKSGGVTLMYNEKYANNVRYNHDINNMVENISFIKKSKADYVVIAPAHIITIMDFEDLVKAHQESGAEITMVYQHIDNADSSFIGSDYLKIKNGKVEEIKINKGNKEERDISLETYVFNVDVLLDIINYATDLSSFYDLKDTLTYLINERDIYTYQYQGYARCFNSVENYLKYSLELLDDHVYSQIFKSNWPIFTRTNDTPPTKYKEHAVVNQSFVANGAVIDGKVEHSIIGREVEIGEGATVINSIIFTGSKIANGAYLENVIVDKDAVIKNITNLIGTTSNPLYVREGDVV